MPHVNKIMEVYNWGDNVLRNLENDAYELFKNFEAICTGVMLDRYEPLEMSRKFLVNIIEALDPKYVEYAKELVEILSEESVEPSHLFEIFGCYRHFGHPTVDEIGGCSSFKNETRKNLEIDPEVVSQVSGAFNKNFILNFIQQHNRWPHCSFHPPDDSKSCFPKLRRVVEKRLLSFSEYDIERDLKGWSYIIFEKELLFDDFPDFTILLSDKSLSPIRDDVINVYHPDLIKYKHKDSKESRRVLLQVLQTEELDCKKIRETVQSKKIPKSWLVVGLHSKEREEKIKSRLFAMMVLEMRLYFNMTEKNLAEQLFKYIPQQTMTWSEAEIMKTLLELSNTTSSSETDFLDIIVSLDFTKWNQRWRFESTHPIFKAIDDLFGTKDLYTFSHKFFKASLFYLSSRYNPPEFVKKTEANEQRVITDWKENFEETETMWIGQEGGCEGLRQKRMDRCHYSSVKSG